MVAKQTNDQLLKQPVQIAKEILTATSEADILRILKDKHNQKLFNEKTWVKDICYTLNWIRSKRIEVLEKHDTEQTTTRSDDFNTPGKRQKISEADESTTSSAEARPKSKDKGKVRAKDKGKKANTNNTLHHGYTYKLLNMKTSEPPSTPDWRALCHNRVMDMEGTSVLLKEIDKRRVGPMSLRYYSAEAIALDPESVKPYLDRSVSWKDGWVHVWNAAKRRGEDSYNTFKMFADEFAHNPDFMCHDDFTYSTNSFKYISGILQKPNELREYVDWAHLEVYGGIRRYYLKDRLMANCTTHRLEYLPHNTNILSLSKSLITQKFNYITLIDMSKSKELPREVFLHLMTIPHLVGLDMTDTRIDTNILFCWMLAMRNGLWNDLRMLCVSGTDIPGGAHIVLCCPMLTYVEIDQNIDQIATVNSQWERRMRLYDRVARAFGRGHFNKANSFRFSRNHFPRSYGIGQKLEEIRALYDELKRMQSSLERPTSAEDFIVKPDFGVEYAYNKRCITQEFEFVHETDQFYSSNKSTTQDPIAELWIGNKKEPQFTQEFFRIQHAPVILESAKLD